MSGFIVVWGDKNYRLWQKWPNYFVCCFNSVLMPFTITQFREANSQKADAVGKIFFNFLKMQVICFVQIDPTCMESSYQLFCSVWKRCTSLHGVQSPLAKGEPKTKLKQRLKGEKLRDRAATWTWVLQQCLDDRQSRGDVLSGNKRRDGRLLTQSNASEVDGGWGGCKQRNNERIIYGKAFTACSKQGLPSPILHNLG